jgi:hypothetical protein
MEMTRDNGPNRIAIWALVVAILSCIGTYLALPQIQGFFASRDPHSDPAAPTDTTEPLPIATRSAPTGTAEPILVPMKTAEPTSPTANASPSSEEEVVHVIRQFNADQTAAVRELVVNALGSTCTGRCYAEQQRYIDQLIRDNLYEVQEQLGFDVLSIHVSGNGATVVTRETWQTKKYDRDTHDCRYHQPAFTTQQTYTLVREGSVWKITWDSFDTPAPTDVPGC